MYSCAFYSLIQVSGWHSYWKHKSKVECKEGLYFQFVLKSLKLVLFSLRTTAVTCLPFHISGQSYHHVLSPQQDLEQVSAKFKSKRQKEVRLERADPIATAPQLSSLYQLFHFPIFGVRTRLYGWWANALTICYGFVLWK